MQSKSESDVFSYSLTATTPPGSPDDPFNADMAAPDASGAPNTGRSAGRPRVPVLNVELIASEALALFTERGNGDFTMSDLATRLGVRPSALYNHISGKEEVFARVRELISDGIDVGVFESLPWGEAVAAWARSYRTAFASHPVTVALFAVTPVAGAVRTIDMYERLVAAFSRAGWPDDEIMPVVVALENFILGSALDKVAPDDILDPGSGNAPVLARVYEAQTRRSDPSDDAFELGLSLLLAGLVARLEVIRARHANHTDNAKEQRVK